MYVKSPWALPLDMTSKPGKLEAQEQAKKGTRKAARTHVLALLVDIAVITCPGRKLPAGRSVRLKSRIDEGSGRSTGKTLGVEGSGVMGRKSHFSWIRLAQVQV